jgi:hypothetical protein
MHPRVGYGCKVVGVSYEWENVGKNSGCSKKAQQQQEEEALLKDLEKEQKKELAAEERKARAAARAGGAESEGADGDTPERRPMRSAAAVDDAEMAKEAANAAHAAERQPVLIAWLDKLMLDPIAELFIEPVSNETAPGYSDIVTMPVCLGGIKQRLMSGKYASTGAEGMKPDFDLLFKNCKKYNEEGSPIVDLARKLRDRCGTLIRSELRHRQKVEADAEAMAAGGKSKNKSRGSAKSKSKVGGAGGGSSSAGGSGVGKRKREIELAGGTSGSKSSAKDITDEPKKPPVLVFCRLTLAPAALSIFCGGGGKTNPLLGEVKLETETPTGNAAASDTSNSLMPLHIAGAPASEPSAPGDDVSSNDVSSIDPLSHVVGVSAGSSTAGGIGGGGVGGGSNGEGGSSSSSTSGSSTTPKASQVTDIPPLPIPASIESPPMHVGDGLGVYTCDVIYRPSHVPDYLLPHREFEEAVMQACGWAGGERVRMLARAAPAGAHPAVVDPLDVHTMSGNGGGEGGEDGEGEGGGGEGVPMSVGGGKRGSHTINHEGGLGIGPGALAVKEGMLFQEKQEPLLWKGMRAKWEGEEPSSTGHEPVDQGCNAWAMVSVDEVKKRSGVKKRERSNSADIRKGGLNGMALSSQMALVRAEVAEVGLVAAAARSNKRGTIKGGIKERIRFKVQQEEEEALAAATAAAAAAAAAASSSGSASSGNPNSGTPSAKERAQFHSVAMSRQQQLRLQHSLEQAMLLNEAKLFLYPQSHALDIRALIDRSGSGSSGYNEHVIVPMDLGLIRRRLKERYYRQEEAVSFDLRVMLRNCHHFHGSESEIGQLATQINLQCIQALQPARQCNDAELELRRIKLRQAGGGAGGDKGAAGSKAHTEVGLGGSVSGGAAPSVSGAPESLVSSIESIEQHQHVGMHPPSYLHHNGVGVVAGVNMGVPSAHAHEHHLGVHQVPNIHTGPLQPHVNVSHGMDALPSLGGGGIYDLSTLDENGAAMDDSGASEWLDDFFGNNVPEVQQMGGVHGLQQGLQHGLQQTIQIGSMQMQMDGDDDHQHVHEQMRLGDVSTDGADPDGVGASDTSMDGQMNTSAASLMNTSMNASMNASLTGVDAPVPDGPQLKSALSRQMENERVTERAGSVGVGIGGGMGMGIGIGAAAGNGPIEIDDDMSPPQSHGQRSRPYAQQQEPAPSSLSSRLMAPVGRVHTDLEPVEDSGSGEVDGEEVGEEVRPDGDGGAAHKKDKANSEEGAVWQL